MQIDKAVIPHHTVEVISWYELVELIKINKQYLNEKKTWYFLDGSLEYFKIRNDLRIFTELFFQRYAKETLGLDTLTYRLAYLKVEAPSISKPESTLGLLSENFQVPENNYYLCSELLESERSDLCAYGGFSLVNLLKFFKDILTPEEYEEIKDFLIRLFIIDAALLQVDRNPNNISFEIPRLSGLSHTKRLRPHILSTTINNKGIIDLSDENQPKLIGMKPSKVFDNERILNIDHNNVFLTNPDDIWAPLFPYSEKLDFNNIKNVAPIDAAKAAIEEEYDGLDPNLAELFMNFPDEAKKYIEALALDDVYRKILEDFSHPNDPIFLEEDEREKIERTIQKRQDVFKQTLKLGR